MRYLRRLNEFMNQAMSLDNRRIIDPYGEEDWDDPEEIVKFLSEFTLPEKPIKRKLTEKEMEKMRNYFKQHSFSPDIDKLGRIILGGGMGPGGFAYITEEDLDLLD